jgi:hypothetical protein
MIMVSRVSMKPKKSREKETSSDHVRQKIENGKSGRSSQRIIDRCTILIIQIRAIIIHQTGRILEIQKS